MAIVNTYSTAFTAARNKNFPRRRGNYTVKKYVGDTLEAAVGDADSVLCFDIRVPVSARITSVLLRSDDCGTTGALDVGFYKGTHAYAIGDATIPVVADAVDRDAIGTAIDINTAALSGTEIRVETLNIDKTNKLAWELAGLSAKPEYPDFFVWGTLQTATTSVGTICLEVEYTN